MKETLSGTYTTTRWHEQAYSQVEDGPKLTVAEKESTFEGGIEGKGIHRNSIIYLSDGSAPFTGHVCITGHIGDREGSFVVEDTGMGTAETASGTWKIIANSASGDLVGLKGEGTWKWEKGNENVDDDGSTQNHPSQPPSLCPPVELAGGAGNAETSSWTGECPGVPPSALLL